MRADVELWMRRDLFVLLGLALTSLIACGSDGSVTGAAPPFTADDAGPSSPPSDVPPPADGAKSVRFIAVGDTGTGSNAQKKVANAMSAVCAARGCDFVQLLGDNLYESGATSADDPIWQSNFEIPYAAIDLDFWAVLGNHDYGARGLGLEFEKGQNQIDYAAKSTKWKMPAAHYRHVPPGSSVEIFALDTNMAMFDQADDQRRDLTEWIAASTATWKIAVGHHPYRSNGPHGNAGDYDRRFGVNPPSPFDGRHVKSFLEGTICGRVDLYLSGHDHSRQWLNVSCRGTELAVSGAGAKATELNGRNPALFESLQLGFLYIVIEGKTLTAEFIDENGAVEFTHAMQKP